MGKSLSIKTSHLVKNEAAACASGVFPPQGKAAAIHGVPWHKCTNTARAESFFVFFCFFVPVPLKHVSHAFSPLLAERVHSLRFTVVKGHVGTHPDDVRQWRIWGPQFGHNLQTRLRKRKRNKKQKQKHHSFQFVSEIQINCEFFHPQQNIRARDYFCNPLINRVFVNLIQKLYE